MDPTRGNLSDGHPTTAERQAKTNSGAPGKFTLPIRLSNKKQVSPSDRCGNSLVMVKANNDATLPQEAETNAMELCDNDSSYSLSASKSPHQVSNGTTSRIPIQNAKPVHTSNSFGQDEQARPRHLSTFMEACPGSCRNNSSLDGAACTPVHQNKGSTDTSVCGGGDIMGMGSWCPEAKEIKIKRSLSGDSALSDMN